MRPAELPASHADRQGPTIGRERDAIDLEPVSGMEDFADLARGTVPELAAPPPPESNSLPSGENDRPKHS